MLDWEAKGGNIPRGSRRQARLIGRERLASVGILSHFTTNTN